MCRQTDKRVTALLLDLKQRGLLEETLVIWGGEFGRTPMAENREGKRILSWVAIITRKHLRFGWRGVESKRVLVMGKQMK